MKTRKLLALVLALLMVCALFSGCGDTKEPAASTPASSTPASSTPASSTPASSAETSEPVEEVSKGTIKVGHLLDKTGTEAATGAQAKTAFDYAVKAIGLVGGYDVVVVEGDCQSNAATAADLAKKMVEEDGVVAIFGPTQIGHKSAVAGYMEDSGVPLIFYNGTPTRMADNNAWVVGEGGGTAQFPTVMADYAYNVLGYREVYTMAQDTTGGRNYVEPFATNFEKLGGTVIESIWIPMGTSELGPYFASLKEADALVGWTSSADGIALWKEWYSSGTYKNMPILASMHGGFTDYYIMNALNATNPEIVEAALGTCAPIMYCYSIDTPENQAFVDGWKEEFGVVPGGNNLPGSCYQALMLLDEALNATGGDTTPEVLMEACLNVDFVGPEGHVTFSEGSHTAVKDVSVAEIVKLEDGTYNYQVVATYEDVPADGLVVG